MKGKVVTSLVLRLFTPPPAGLSWEDLSVLSTPSVVDCLIPSNHVLNMDIIDDLRNRLWKWRDDEFQSSQREQPQRPATQAVVRVFCQPMCLRFKPGWQGPKGLSFQEVDDEFLGDMRQNDGTGRPRPLIVGGKDPTSWDNPPESASTHGGPGF